MDNKNPISPEALKHNTGGRVNGTIVDSAPVEAGQAGRGFTGLNSPAVSEILNQPPSWLVRWGITAFFGVILLVFAVSWWVRYPELIKGNLSIVANNLPKSVVVRSEGRLVQLRVKEGQRVQKGQLLAQIETTANPAEVAQLGFLTDSLVSITLDGNLQKAYSIQVPPFFELGELQKSYQSFQEAFVRTKSFVGDGAAFQKRQILSSDLSQIQALKTHLQHQLEDQESDFSLVKADVEMNEKLLKEKVISQIEYRQAMSKYFNKKQAVEQSRSQLKNNELAQNQKKQELLELSKNIIEQQNALLQSLRSLKSEIQAWKQRFQAIAPIT